MYLWLGTQENIKIWCFCIFKMAATMAKKMLQTAYFPVSSPKTLLYGSQLFSVTLLEVPLNISKFAHLHIHIQNGY